MHKYAANRCMTSQRVWIEVNRCGWRCLAPGEAPAAMTMRRFPILLAVLLVIVAYELYLHRAGVAARLHNLTNIRPTGRSILEPGQAWPGLQMAELGGMRMKIAPKPGRLLYVNVFATWCPDCRLETPALEQLAHEAQTTGLPLDVVGIDTQEDAEQVAGFVQQYGLSYPIFMDGDDKLSQRLLGVHFIPSSFIVDSRGVVRARIAGALTLAQMKAGVHEVWVGGSFAR